MTTILVSCYAPPCHRYALRCFCVSGHHEATSAGKNNNKRARSTDDDLGADWDDDVRSAFDAIYQHTSTTATETPGATLPLMVTATILYQMLVVTGSH